MFKKLNRKQKFRLLIVFAFLFLFDMVWYLIFENDRPFYLELIGSIFTSTAIVFGLAIFFNKFNKDE
jgi:hypothetical protein